MSEKQYAERDLMEMDCAGNYYCRHVSAMTREGLHSKSDIAAELGWRDMQIAALQQKLDAAEAKVRQLEWDSVFIPKDIEAALAVMGVALPESKEEFNFSINRWIQRLVDRVIRVGPELDAERNNLRAEGADNVATYHSIRMDALKEVHRQGYLFHKAAYGDAVLVATQLRYGKEAK